jgi:hypothetical protein
MKKFFLTLPVLTCALFACQLSQPPINPQVLGTVVLPFGDSALTTQVAIADNQISFSPIAIAAVNDNAVFNTRFIRRSFRITNNSGGMLTNLIFHAYNKAGNVQATALKSITDFAGQPTLNATSVFPKHGMTNTLSVDSSAADLQLFTESDVTTAQSNASSVLNPSDYLLAYGYLVQQRSNDTNSDNNPRTIGAGETGTVTISYQIPKDTSSTYSFFATFSLRTTTDTDLIQTQEEQLAGTIAGQATPTNVRFVTVPGGQACGTTTGAGTSLQFINQLRIAGKVGGTGIDTPTYAFNTPSIASTVTSSADSGAGSLRETITNPAANTGVCIENNVTLSSQIAIGNNLAIYGGNNVVITGNNTTRVFEISNGFNVGLYGFAISGGTKVADFTNFGGGAILNAGNLTLSGMKVNNNRFDGGLGLQNTPNLNANAKGGAIFNSSSGVLNIAYSEFKSNSVVGAAGTFATPNTSIAGGAGGNANGGAIYNQGTMSRLSATFAGVERISNH